MEKERGIAPYHRREMTKRPATGFFPPWGNDRVRRPCGQACWGSVPRVPERYYPSWCRMRSRDAWDGWDTWLTRFIHQRAALLWQVDEDADPPATPFLRHHFVSL